MIFSCFFACFFSCLSLISITVLKTMTKSNLWGREFISYSLSLGEVRVGTQGKTMEAETEAETMKNAAYWLVPGSCSDIPGLFA